MRRSLRSRCRPGWGWIGGKGGGGNVLDAGKSEWKRVVVVVDGDDFEPAGEGEGEDGVRADVACPASDQDSLFFWVKRERKWRKIRKRRVGRDGENRVTDLELSRAGPIRNTESRWFDSVIWVGKVEKR
jgi:hypothetical protein